MSLLWFSVSMWDTWKWINLSQCLTENILKCQKQSSSCFSSLNFILFIYLLNHTFTVSPMSSSMRSKCSDPKCLLQEVEESSYIYRWEGVSLSCISASFWFEPSTAVLVLLQSLNESSVAFKKPNISLLPSWSNSSLALTRIVLSSADLWFTSVSLPHVSCMISMFLSSSLLLHTDYSCQLDADSGWKVCFWSCCVNIC